MKKVLVLLGGSLILGWAFTSCNFPIGGIGLETEAVPVESAESIEPAEAGALEPLANTDGAETILIPGGSFWMGSEDWDAEADPDETPRHQVTLSGFRIYTYEVTNSMYARCVEAGDCIPVLPLERGPTSHYDDPAFADHPVTGVDWLMARNYCAWANSRLPTEAEWELASRSTDSLRYPWGDEDPTCERVNMLGCSVPPDTLAAGSLAGGNSAYDGWDMSGNVWEWVHDWYDEDSYFFSSAVSPLGPNYSETKVVRGGGLYSEPVMMRSAARQSADPNRAYDDVGFRCVVLGDLELPDGYTPVDEVHERVPPDSLDGGGEHVEDPDDGRSGGVSFYDATLGCPTEDGRLSFDYYVRATCGGPTFSGEVQGIPYACDYDESTMVLHCEGPLPPGYADLPFLRVLARVDCSDPPGYAWRSQDITLPDDCESGEVPAIELLAYQDCPEADVFAVTFEAAPPVVWDTIQLVTSSDRIDVRCASISGTQTRCIAPALSEGGFYRFDLHGTTSDGREVDAPHWLMGVRIDCPVEARTSATPICFEDRLPMVSVNYSPGTRVLTSVSADGSPLHCMGAGPTGSIWHENCDLPGEPGASVEVTACFDGEVCQNWSVRVPDCGAPPVFEYSIEPICLPDGSAAASTHISPPTFLASFEAGGTGLPCTGWGAGWYVCTGLPGAPHDTVPYRICLGTGPCNDGRITIPDCAVPSAGDWTIAGVGCADETRIFVTVDTGLDWVVEGGLFNTYVYDGPTEFYTCSAVSGIPGRLYCTGPRPGSPGALTVRLQQTGSPYPVDQTWDDWPLTVAGIPDCSPEAPPPDGLAPCSSFTTSASCPRDRCDWVIGGSGGECHDLP